MVDVHSGWYLKTSSQKRGPKSKGVVVMLMGDDVLRGKSGWRRFIEQVGREDPAVAAGAYAALRMGLREPILGPETRSGPYPAPSYASDGSLNFCYTSPSKGGATRATVRFAEDGAVVGVEEGPCPKSVL